MKERRRMDAPRKLATSLWVWACLASAALADPADDQFAVASAHYAAGRWEMAIAEFRAHLEEFPVDAVKRHVRFYLAESLLQSREFGAAASEFLVVARECVDAPIATKASFRAGEAHYLAGDLSAAERELAAFIERHADDPLCAYALPYLGDVSLRQNQADRAREYFRRALAAFPQGAMQDDCRFGVARAAEMLGEHEEAGRLYAALSAKKAAALADDAAYRLCVTHLASGDAAKAAAELAAFEDAFPDSSLVSLARVRRAQALHISQDHDAAIALAEPLVSDEAVGVEASYWLAMALLARGEPASAFVALEAARPKATTDDWRATLEFEMGQCQLRAGHAKKSLRHFGEVAKQWPEADLADRAMIGRLEALQALERYDELEKEAESFGKRFPDSGRAAAAARVLARSLLARDKAGEALTVLMPHVAAFAEPPPLDRDAKFAAAEFLKTATLLSSAYHALGQDHDALAALEACELDGAPDDAKRDALQARAVAEFSLGRHAAAIEPLQVFLALSPTTSAANAARAHLAVCHAALGDCGKAGTELAAMRANDAPIDQLLAAARSAADVANRAGDIGAIDLLGALLVEQATTGDDAALAWRQLAGMRREREQLDLTAEALEQAAHTARRSELRATLAIELAGVQVELAQKEKAEKTYASIFDDESLPSDERARALRLAARLAHERHADDRALELYDRLLDFDLTDDDRASALYESAWALRGMGRDRDAKARFVLIADHHIGHRVWADSVYRLAELAHKDNDPETAQAQLDRLFETKPPHDVAAHAHFLAGQLAAARGDWPAVERSMRMLSGEAGDSSLRLMARYWSAEAAFRLEKYDTALECWLALEPLIIHEPAPWPQLVVLRTAQTLAYLERWEEAQTATERLTRDAPDFDRAFEADYVLGRCHAALARFDQAREAYRRVTRSAAGAKTETAAMAQWMIGETYFHQKRYADAIREYLRLEILYAFPTWQAAATFEAARCHEHLGEWKQATELYVRLLKLYPETRFAPQAAERLKTAARLVEGKTPQ